MRIEALESRALLSVVPAAEGPAFRVNTQAALDQVRPSIAADADGNFVVVWQGGQPNPTPWDVYGRRYAADGTPIGDEFLVNAESASSRYEAKVAMDEDGDFVVVWEGYGTGGTDVYARRYAADGTAKGPEFVVNTTRAGYQRAPAVASRAGGAFTVAWVGWDQSGGHESDVYARRFDADGDPQGPEFLVNDDVYGSQHNPAVAVDRAGGEVFAWSSFSGVQTDGSNVVALRYGPGGTPLHEPVRVNTDSTFGGYGLAVGADDAGNFVVGWAGDHHSLARRFDAIGVPLGGELVAIPGGSNATYTNVAVGPGGNFVVVGESGLGGVGARSFDADGTPQGPAFAVSANSVVDMGVAMPRKGNGFVVAYAGRGQEGAGNTMLDVYARRYAFVPATPAARVVGRHVLYRHNPGGFLASPGPADDATIATDKRPLLPGQAASFANVTSYDKGINGVMVDIAGLAPDTVLTRSDFDFGESNPPVGVSVRRGAGVDGSDRYTLLWHDANPTRDYAGEATANGWLTVTAKGPHIGMAADDVFSFGSLVGEAGDGSGGAGWRISALDLAAVKRSLNRPAPVISPVDFNRDGLVNALDLAIVKRNLNRRLGPPPPIPVMAVAMAGPGPRHAAGGLRGGAFSLETPDADIRTSTTLP